MEGPVLKRAINRSAQTFGEPIETQDLENIYEWTYKYQMLQQEERLGDYGLPQVLSDKAYMEKFKLETLLEEKLDNVYEKMYNVYENWINAHEPLDSDFEQNAREYWNSRRHDFEKGYDSLADLADLIGEDSVIETVRDFLSEIYKEEHPEEDPYDAWIRYLDSITAKKAQQEEFEFMQLPEFAPGEPVKPIEEMSLEELQELPSFENYKEEILDEIEKQSYFDTFIEEQAEAERENYDQDTALGDVKEMFEGLKEWDTLDIKGKIILFQEALTTMHNNGEMAQYLLDSRDAVEILNGLSEGVDVPEWDYTLSKMLGYPLGSKLSAPTQEWFIPAALNRIAFVISMLDNIKEATVKLTAVIRKCKKGDAQKNKPICLYTHDGSRLLGRHPSVESAKKQESAIKAQGSLIKAIDYIRLAGKEV